MPVARVAMHKIKEVLRLKHVAQLSHRQIAGALSLSLGVVTKYLTAAERAGVTYPLPDDYTDAQLAHALFDAPLPAPIKRATLDFAYIHQELKRKVDRWREFRCALS